MNSSIVYKYCNNRYCLQLQWYLQWFEIHLNEHIWYITGVDEVVLALIRQDFSQIGVFMNNYTCFTVKESKC